jgi:hypothetical protein
MNTHVVTKALPKGEVVLQPGTEVDASEWKFTKSLEEQRYIRPLQPDERQRMGRKDNDGSNRK